MKTEITCEDAANWSQRLKPNPNTQAVRLFVYGTLKRGRWNDRLTRDAIRVERAWTWGRMYDLAMNYPAMELPDASILAQGTGDVFADAQRCWESMAITPQRPSGDWDWVEGELVTFKDAWSAVPPIDRLEGFRPGKSHSFYTRVLVPIWKEDQIAVPAWTYDGRYVTGREARITFW